MGQICSFLWTRKNKKAFSPTGGFAPWTPLGAPPPDPRYRLALRVRNTIRTLCSSKLILKKTQNSTNSESCIYQLFRFQ